MSRLLFEPAALRSDAKRSIFEIRAARRLAPVERVATQRDALLRFEASQR